MHMRKEKRERGRPQGPINWRLFEKLCGLHCTQSEIASILMIDADTLRARAREWYHEPDFGVIYKKFEDRGKCSLRRSQFVLSRKNPAMAIWLGKQWLGQRDTDLQNQRTSSSIDKFLDYLDKVTPNPKES